MSKKCNKRVPLRCPQDHTMTAVGTPILAFVSIFDFDRDLVSDAGTLNLTTSFKLRVMKRSALHRIEP
jgi:hypothetical protein